MENYPPEAWQRLGRLLKRRRPQVSPRYRVRKVFAAEHGLTDKTVQDIENAYRTTFTVETIASMESAYRLAPGSIREVLDDPTLTEFPRRSVSATVELGGPIRAAASVNGAADYPDPFRDPGDLPGYVELTSLPAEEAQVLSALYLLTPEERLQLSIVVRQMVAKRPQHNGGAQPSAGRHGQDAG